MTAMPQKTRRLIGDLLIAVILLLLFVFDALGGVDLALQDRVYQRPGLADPRVVILGIDDKSMDELGLFTRWSRQVMADAINILNRDPEHRPAVIAVDVYYGGESEDRDADMALAEAARAGGNVVVASVAYFKDTVTWQQEIELYQTPYEPLSSYAAHGLANSTIDSDGVIRNALMKTGYDGGTLYSFPYTVYREYTGQALEFAESHDYAPIAYTGKPGEFSSSGYSFSDIFDESFDPTFFEDCIVMIGPYANGLQDAYTAAIDRSKQMHGVEIHANVVQMLLEENFKRHPSRILSFAILAAVILAGMLLARVLDIRVLLAVYAVLAAGVGVGSYAAYRSGYVLPLLYPPAALAVMYLYELIYGYVLHRAEQMRVKSAFKKYVDPKLVDKLMESGEANSDEIGVLKDIAVLFVDIRGFTPMSEALKGQPGQVVKILNEYLELTSSAVFDQGGSVDKFIGDATMALFNGFVPLDDFVFRAVKAAWQMVDGAAEVNASIREKYGTDVGFGIGVHCGPAIVGNLGPTFRKDYTAIGDTVNTAARLESNAKRSQVLVSRAVYERLGDRIRVESVGEIPLKGKAEKLEVFSVIEAKG